MPNKVIPVPEPDDPDKGRAIPERLERLSTTSDARCRLHRGAAASDCGAPSVKVQLAGIRMLFDWLVVCQVMPMTLIVQHYGITRE
jgi:hypothetical protein